MANKPVVVPKSALVKTPEEKVKPKRATGPLTLKKNKDGSESFVQDEVELGE